MPTPWDNPAANQFFNIARGAEIVPIGDRDYMVFIPDILIDSARQKVGPPVVDGMDIKRPNPVTPPPGSPMYTASSIVAVRQRVLLYARMNSNRIINGFRWVPYITDGNPDTTTVLPLREVFSPRIVYDRSSNSLSMWFWTNVKEEYTGTTYDQAQVVPIGTSDYAAMVANKSPYAGQPKRVLCYAVGQLMHAYVDGGLMGYDSKIIIENGYGTNNTYDIIPVFMCPKIVNVTVDNLLANNVGIAVDGWYNASRWISLAKDVDFSSTAPSISTITMLVDRTSSIKVGDPIKFKLTASTYYYAICNAITANLLTISGPPLTLGAGDLTELYYGTPEMVSQIDYFVQGTYGDAINTAVLYSDMYTKFKWAAPKAYMVHYRAMQQLAAGTTQPKVNVTVNAADVSTNDSGNGIQLTTAGTWVENAAGAIDPATYDINPGEAVEISVKAAAVATTAAKHLTVSCIFVNE